jgi:hypothetical protein
MNTNKIFRISLSIFAVQILIFFLPSQNETLAQLRQQTTTKRISPNKNIPVVQSSNKVTQLVKIGGSAVGPTLTGKNLDKVKRVVLVKPGTNTVARGYVVRKTPKAGGKYLRISIEARKSAAPGSYRIQLQYGENPLKDGKRPPVHKITLPKNIAIIRSAQMAPRVTKFKPFTGCESTSCDSVRAREKLARFITIISDVPGTKVVSVSRNRGRGTDAYCYYTPWRSTTQQKLVEKNTARFIAPGKLEITTSQGYFSFKGRCRMAFIIKTKSRFNEQYHHYVNFTQDKKPRVLTVKEGKKRKKATAQNTWDLKKYLTISRRTSTGACSGNSIGPSGSHPVGMRKYKNDIIFKIRSGPIGTTCAWEMYPKHTLKPGWQLKLNFKDSYKGRNCKITYTKRDAAGRLAEFGFDFRRTAYIYFSKEGGYIRSRDPYRILQLSCSPTVSNDNAVSLRITSIEVESPPTDAKGRITWRSAFNN